MTAKDIAIWVLAAVALLVIAGFSIETMRPMPERAKIYIDRRHSTYVSPPCLAAGVVVDFAQARPGDFRPTTVRELRAWQDEGMPLKPDERCKNDGDGFFSGGQPLLLRLFGLGRERWDEQGNWNW